MFLKVSQLSKSYEKKLALEDIEFNLQEGELLAILGPSGCGKSTLLRCIGGFEQITKGKIELLGKDLVPMSAEDRPTATVFQSYGLFPHMNVLDNIIYGLKFQNISKKERVKQGIQILELIELEGYENKKIQELSGGEQQRVALGRSLIVKPKLLLLDEPLSNLDERLRLTMREEIKYIQKKFNITTIFVTHDQEEAFAIADKIILMNEGKIVQIGTAEEIYDDPTSLFSLNFIGQANHLEDEERYVRPERIKIVLSEEGNSRIVGKQFKGNSIEYTVEMDSDKTIQVLVLNNGWNDFEIENKVSLEFEGKGLRRK